MVRGRGGGTIFIVLVMSILKVAMGAAVPGIRRVPALWKMQCHGCWKPAEFSSYSFLLIFLFSLFTPPPNVGTKFQPESIGAGAGNPAVSRDSAVQHTFLTETEELLPKAEYLGLTST